MVTKPLSAYQIKLLFPNSVSISTVLDYIGYPPDLLIHLPQTYHYSKPENTFKKYISKIPDFRCFILKSLIKVPGNIPKHQFSIVFPGIPTDLLCIFVEAFQLGAQGARCSPPAPLRARTAAAARRSSARRFRSSAGVGSSPRWRGCCVSHSKHAGFGG